MVTGHVTSLHALCLLNGALSNTLQWSCLRWLGCWETRGRCCVVWCGECGEERTAEGAGAGAQSRSCGFGRFGHVLLPQMLPCPCLPSVRPVYPLKCWASERMLRQVGAVENWRRRMLCDLRRYPREPPEISFAVVVNLDAAAQMV